MPVEGSGALLCLALRPDGGIAAVGSSDRTIRLVELATGIADPVARLQQIHRNTRSSKVHGTPWRASKARWAGCRSS